MNFKEAYDPFRALKSAWSIIKTAPSATLIGGLLLWVCDAGTSAGVNLSNRGGRIDVKHLQDFDQAGRAAWDAVSALVAGFGVAFAILACGLGIAAWLFKCLLQIGMANCVEHALVRRQDDMGELFNARGRWPSMVAVTFLCGVISMLALIPGFALGGSVGALVWAAWREEWVAVTAGVSVFVLYLPVAFYVWLGINLAPRAVAIEGLGAVEAISRSWFLVRGNRLALFLYHLVFGLALLCCCLWCLLFVPTTFVEVCGNDSYLRLVRSGEPHEWGKVAQPDSGTPDA